MKKVKPIELKYEEFKRPEDKNVQLKASILQEENKYNGIQTVRTTLASLYK